MPEPNSRHVKMLGCGKLLSDGGEFVVQQAVELLWARPLVVSVSVVVRHSRCPCSGVWHLPVRRERCWHDAKMYSGIKFHELLFLRKWRQSLCHIFSAISTCILLTSVQNFIILYTLRTEVTEKARVFVSKRGPTDSMMMKFFGQCVMVKLEFCNSDLCSFISLTTKSPLQSLYKLCSFLI